MKCIAAKSLYLAAVALACSGAAFALGSSNYADMYIEADAASGNLSTGRLKEVNGNVHVELAPAEPGGEAMTIDCGRMTFTYEGDAEAPSEIMLTGGVKIPNPLPKIVSLESRRAVWAFAENTITFDDNVKMRDADGKYFDCTTITINLETGEFDVGRFETNMNLSAGGGPGAAAQPASSDLIKPSDVRNWPVLVRAIKAPGTGTPAARVVRLLDEDTRDVVQAMPEAKLLEKTDLLCKQLNKVIQSPGLYEAAAWKDVDLGAEAKELLAEDKLDEARQVRLNRLLIEAAWPEAFGGSN